MKFLFDCISRCFLNKIINFDALLSVSLKIGYSAIYCHVFDNGNTILRYLIARGNDDLNVIGYTRFFYLIFSYFYLNATFQNDKLLSVFNIADKAIKNHVNGDKKNGFTGPAFIPLGVRRNLQSKVSTLHGFAISDATPDSVSDAMEQSPTHSVPDLSIPSK